MKTARIELCPEPEIIPVQSLARIVKPTDTGWLLEGSGEHFVAGRAASCLLTPAIADRVLVTRAGDESWILAVLERNQDNPAVLSVSGDLEINAIKGNVSLHGDTGLGLSSTDAITMDAPRLRVSTRLADIITGKLSWMGRELEARFDGVKFMGRLVDSVIERFSRKAKHSVRHVEQMDQLRSGTIDYRADANMSFRACNVLTKAEQLARIDGDQIHMG
jgi:hypothetical protein